MSKKTKKNASRRHSWAFTLIEATVAIALAALAGFAILLAIGSTVQSSADDYERTMALGIAQQLMDEIVGHPYMDSKVSPYQTTLGPASSESIDGTRKGYDDIDDYNGFVSQPPVDRFGIMLGSDDGHGGERHPNFRLPTHLLSQFEERVRVYYVRAYDFRRELPSGETSDYRAVEVTINRVDADGTKRPLVQLRRIVAYVPRLQ